MKPNKSKKNTKKISFDFNKFKDIIIKNRYLVLLIVGLIGLFAVVFGVSYAFFTNSVTSKDFVVYTGNLAVTYEKKTNVININNAIPMSNANGLATTPYSFDVKNTGTIVSKYQVRLELDNNNTLPLEDIKISVYRNDIEYLKPTRISDLNATLVIADDGLLSPTESDNYKIRLWVDLGAGNDAVGKEFKAKIVIDGLQNVEEGYTFNTRPIITLNKDSNGNTHISLVKGNTYNELGAYSVRDDKDVLLRSNVSVSYEYFDGTNLNTVNNINNTTLNNVGIYYATYSISDSSNLEGKAVRVITVNNTPVLPTISLNGNSSMEVYQNDVFVDPGVTVGTGVNVLTLGEVKTSIPGIYIIRYIAIDSNGNLNSVTRSVEVLENYAESILNGADPVLTDNLVPVTIDDDGTVKKANTNSKWYEYGNKNWANAVVLADDTITYNNGATIPESNIESYFVWIPKYSYQLWDLGNYNSLTTLDNTKPHTIPIRFGLDDTNDSNSGECTTPMTSGASGNCQVGDYMTHPAFISMNTNGIWVGKFKTTGTVDNITVKPNAVSLRNINVNQMFTAAYNYKRNIDSHMMKNTEWGAITYLSYSNYGINDKIEANSNSSYLTGYNGQNSTYNTSSGYLASSTGNITGIYDMNGPSQEYMAAYISNNQGSAGFGADPISLYDQKYFDIYNASSNETTYQYRILGDATGEMGPFTNSSNIYVGSWHNGYSKFVYSLNPWFGRSSNIGSENYGSQSVFGRDNGRALNWQSFRIVLAPISE